MNLHPLFSKMQDKYRLINLLLVLLISALVFSCKEEVYPPDPPEESCATENYFSQYPSKNFNMGFSTWAYDLTVDAVDDTYQFIANHSDIYSEHIDYKIPWDAWINDLPLPAAFTNDIAGRVNRRIPNKQLLLSVSLLNSARNELAEDMDGTTPNYTNLNDEEIENAYFKHINYLVNAFSPNYLVIAIEVNELKKNAPEKWESYKALMQNVTTRIKQIYPNIRISESITLHNLYEPEVSNPTEYIDEIVTYMNQMDFVAISYYPFFKGQHTASDFQQAFDFLHSKTDKTIAFVETNHIAENLSVPSYNLFIESDACEQNVYLETLLSNAQEQDYEFVIWWAHRDYDALWETFPAATQDLGKLWRDTGLLDENGEERVAMTTWNNVLNK